MLKFTISNRQLKVIKRKAALAEAYGDLNTMLRCQSLQLIFEQNMSLKDVASIAQKSTECIRLWLIEFSLKGVKFLEPRLPVGRQPKLTKAQCKLLKEMLDNPPTQFGFPSGCWSSAMISMLIEREFGVKYSIKYIPELMKRLGFSWQKARFEAILADAKKRADWVSHDWPLILAKAKKSRSYLLFEDEASFALWGSLSYSWSRKGNQPIVKTKGSRKSYKMFAMIDYFTGKTFYQGVEGKLNSESYIDFLKHVKTNTRKPLMIIHDCASYHTSAEVTDFLEGETRMEVHRLPPFSPDFNPIEKFWKNLKKLATHLIYFPEFDDLIIRVEAAMDFFSKNCEEVLKVFKAFKKKELAAV